MTAEIAILNKSGVALASDSAVTIAAGSKEEKIFFSADKLFELSRRNSIGIMIYNGMQFMQAPLPILINDFRQSCPAFDCVADAATAFLQHLNKWGATAPDAVKNASVQRIVIPIIEMINDRLSEKLQELLKNNTPKEVAEAFDDVLEDVVALFERLFDRQDDASFIGGKPRMSKSRRSYLMALVKRHATVPEPLYSRVVGICETALFKQPLSDSKTGIVIAGYGQKEVFPTLVSYEIDGMVFGRLKYIESSMVDIDRQKDRARVLPFAQKEMVERFLYGIDSEIEDNINKWCRNTVPIIKEQILDALEMEEADREALHKKASQSERTFLTELRETGFETIRSQSRAAIEGMVEFMPKPELATMAEALVNLTSIKRRVSRGMETVGGPVDVALISRSEGFVWIKRKHYFPAELNPRYSHRVAQQTTDQNGGSYAEQPYSREADQEGGGTD